MVLKNKAGKIITVSMSAVLAKVVGKTYIITTFHDITEQRKFEEKLKKSEEKYRVLAEQSRDGIAIVALDGTMKYANSYLANLLGYKTKEMIGQHVLKFTHPDFRAATIEVIKHFNSGTKEMRFEAADITKDGRRIDIEDSIALIDYGGQKCGLIIVRDVSERKKMLAILEESSNRYRGLFET